MRKILLALVTMGVFGAFSAFSFDMANNTSYELEGRQSIEGKHYKLRFNSTIAFSAKKFGFVSVDGVFRNFGGILVLDSENKIAQLEGEVKIDSIFSDNTKRDEHLKQSDFLSSSDFPLGRFTMRKYEAENDNKGKVIGTLSLHGVSREVVLESVLDIRQMHLSLKGEINIKDFGLKGTAMVSDRVKILIESYWEE